MAFKTFECWLPDGGGFGDVPPEGWSPDGAVITIIAATGEPSVYSVCDPSTSRFTGAELQTQGMSESDFYTLWAAIAGLMVTGAIFKQLRLQLGKH